MLSTIEHIGTILARRTRLVSRFTKASSGNCRYSTTKTPSESALMQKDPKELTQKNIQSHNTSKQAPNRESTWSKSQRPKQEILKGARFEQTNLELQPQPLAAIELIAKEPVRKVPTRLTWCDGGGGPLGHPKVYINLDAKGPVPCGYCGIRYQLDDSHHH